MQRFASAVRAIDAIPNMVRQWRIAAAATGGA